MASFTVRATATSPLAPAAVWERILEGKTWAGWFPAVAWALFEGPPASGTFVTLQLTKGRQTAYAVEAAEPPSRLVLALRSGPLARLVLEFGVAEDGAGSRIALQLELGGPLGSMLFGPAARRLAAGLDAAAAGLARA